ncbi:hypothetical protein PGTUg99_021418 [Puccinia graminis f. sp. tritici]|uniref:Uncharacterized protein n=1 Tax=Puccinia graminis f. sp. tritici TaxID=56615 RepID=A0A5B0NW63_PUCGR|nr:hypothetical protein PGTUg99_021418 [Puccinia graminis f. sp. tritici]
MSLNSVLGSHPQTAHLILSLPDQPMKPLKNPTLNRPLLTTSSLHPNLLYPTPHHP